MKEEKREIMLLYSFTWNVKLFPFSALTLLVGQQVGHLACKIIEGLRERTEYFHNYETEKITRKASDAAENLQLYQVVRFFHPRSLCTTTHLMSFSERPPIYASCMTTLGGRTEQLDIIAGFLLRHWLYV